MVLSVQPKIYTRSEHPIRKDHIDEHALSAILRLQHEGYTAYLVGGSVRDLLVKLHPKDYDISTSARPEEIKKIFGRQCLLIGRRFRLAHLRYGEKIIEAATFRAGDPTSSSLIVRDNRWGSEEEDVLRRDFTMNALFFDPTEEKILDYVGGVEDIHRGLLQTIGEPQTRFKQDPVRMIRLLKFQARFGFRSCENTLHAMKQCRYEILKSSQARVLEEVLKMLESGKSAPFFRLVTDHGFMELLFPCFHHFFTDAKDAAMSYLTAIDEVNSNPAGKLDRTLLLSAIIFPILEQEVMTLTQDRQSPLPTKEIIHLAETLLHGISTSSFVHFPKRLLQSVYMIIVNQFRLTPHNEPPKFRSRFHSIYDFQDALSFLRIRALVKPELSSALEQWEALASKRQ